MITPGRGGRGTRCKVLQGNHPSWFESESLALVKAPSASLCIVSLCTNKTRVSRERRGGAARLELKSTSARENHKENGAETASQAHEYQDANEYR